MGVDMVTHSATKYLGGHSDVVLGLVVTNNEDLAEQVYFIQNSTGAVPGPNDCFLALRGVKTLHVRMERHCTNAQKIAHFLRQQPAISNVYWPGFTDHEGYDIAAKQMQDFGGMVSFDLKSGSMEDAKKVMTSTELFSLAESLGGVESLVGHPATMTHASIPKEEREKSGLTDTLIRLSVGIEDAEDLEQDLANALSTL
jgi:cystathionine beta-lyase